ncbi:hypothetical protein LJC58_05170 [Lachnospiraceae bacterium OttesenSCG-928-D06]|nr:hypothetical protein [Lachnospiraceae bacterium OttesenSCG-928-D06]
MNDKISKLLKGEGQNHILPFLWLHGEEEEVLRDYIQVIYDCGIGALCVESRPHPDFCGPKWWADMDVILEEARRRQMKVWILDDSHFPTGYCNGALKDADSKLKRQSITYKVLATLKGGERLVLNPQDYISPPPFERNLAEQYLVDEIRTFDDDVFLGAIAVNIAGQTGADIVQLEDCREELCFTAPSGEWRIYACYLTRNRGPHRDYMNMMDGESCHKLIEAVYEPHYARYKEDFGTTIAGFFSDEPELGNGHLYELNRSLPQIHDHPWSREVERELRHRWGEEWLRYIPLLWENGFSPDFKGRIRYDYMDVVTKSVEKNFSFQIGEWCRSHGVEYIGHIIEDNNQHSRSGSSLGHFFRGMAGQDMSGIDDIGGQVLPQQEDARIETNWSGSRDGIFYHYALGKLGASAAAIDPLKKGRAMCEIFGNYGWAEGVYLEKYLADHFMVRGINYFVPHAFSMKPFPDPDCPPHFYAHGHNPQYRHFAQVIGYMNRVCELISDGTYRAEAAILYHGEGDWAGGTCMFSQEPARVLADNQINFDFIPADVFAEEKYGTVLGKNLEVNHRIYQVLIIPETTYLPSKVAEAAGRLVRSCCPVIFVNSLPKGLCDGNIESEAELLRGLLPCDVVSLGDLVPSLMELQIGEIKIEPVKPLLRYLHYFKDRDLYYFVNEAAERYCGTITIPITGSCYVYNAWDNCLEKANVFQDNGKTELKVEIEPRKSLILIFDETKELLREPVCGKGESIELMAGWTRSTCKGIDYPLFTDHRKVLLPDRVEAEWPNFGGFVRYESELTLPLVKQAVLEITEEAEGVEVFINGNSAGIQVTPIYRYDITKFLKEGVNQIVIETATTLERVIPKTSRIPGRVMAAPSNICGIHGKVTLWIVKREIE